MSTSGTALMGVGELQQADMGVLAQDQVAFVAAFETAERALPTRTVSEVQELRDRAASFAHYLKRRGYGLTERNRCALFTSQCDLRLGEMLSAAEKAQGKKGLGLAFGLKWSDVDFEQRRIQVVRSLVRIKGVKGWSLMPPKTKNARRSVPLPPVAMDELKRWKRQQNTERLALGPEWQDHGFVFTSNFGAPLDGSNAHGAFKRVMAAADLGTWGPQAAKKRSGPPKRRPFTPAFRVYDLRHSCATLLLLAGESAKVVSERLGHASITLTLDTYSHVLPTMQEAAAEKLELMFGTSR